MAKEHSITITFERMKVVGTSEETKTFSFKTKQKWKLFVTEFGKCMVIIITKLKERTNGRRILRALWITKGRMSGI